MRGERVHCEEERGCTVSGERVHCEEERGCTVRGERGTVRGERGTVRGERVHCEGREGHCEEERGCTVRCERCRMGGMWICSSCHESVLAAADAFEIEYREPFDPPSPACAECSSPISRETGFVLMGDTGDCHCCSCIREQGPVFAVLSVRGAGRRRQRR